MQDLREAIGKVQAARGDLQVSNSGQMLCPFHGERTPSARLWQNKHHAGQIEFHCFGCGKSMKFKTFYEAITDKEYKSKEQPRQAASIDLNMFASRCNAYFQALLGEEHKGHPEKAQADKALEYLTSRGVEREDIEKHQIGFIMRQDAGEQAELEGCSWAKEKARECFIVYPVRNERGEVINAQLEDFLNRGKGLITKQNLAGRKVAAWYSQPPTEESKQGLWYVTEGIQDALALSKLDVRTIALLGEPSKEQIDKLKEFKSLVLALDKDEGGSKQKAKLAKELYPHADLWEFPLPEGIKDPSQLLKERGVQGLMNAQAEADRLDPFPPLIEEVEGIIEGFLKLKAQAVPIPGEFDFLREFLPDGLVPGLYALAGVPEAGKTTLLNQLADALAKEGIPTFYFHTEEPKYRLLSRTVKKEGAQGIRELVNIAPAILKNRRIFEMTPEYTADKLAEIIQGIMLRLKKQGKDKLVFIVDSLHAMRLSKENERGDIREKAILKTEMLSHIARDLQIPVIFTSFMPRASYERTPDIGIFKESGDIEYLVDVAACLWREKKEADEAPAWEKEPALTISFVKNRFGRSGGTASAGLKLIREKCKFIADETKKGWAS